jgi:pyridoxamine 5'-phosphate oxidase
LQLASVGLDGTPRLRTLVFRGWASGSALDLLTDGRSAKAAELAQQPAVELLWLLPRARCQFRLRGRLAQLPDELLARERARHWRELSPSARSLWAWPEPGALLQGDAPFPTELNAEEPIPAHFRLLRIAPAQVELLELGEHPHRRRCWRQEDGWRERRLNP